MAFVNVSHQLGVVFHSLFSILSVGKRYAYQRCRSCTASFIYSVLPWLLVALTYDAAFFEAFVNWSGLLILGYANFTLPLLLDLTFKRVRAVMRSATGADADDVTTITTCVFISVTASITMVIVMSVFDNLTLSLGSFVLLIGLMVSGTIFVHFPTSDDLELMSLQLFHPVLCKKMTCM